MSGGCSSDLTLRRRLLAIAAPSGSGVTTTGTLRHALFSVQGVRALLRNVLLNFGYFWQRALIFDKTILFSTATESQECGYIVDYSRHRVEDFFWPSRLRVFDTRQK
jgi:hypothetical protein